ncbi:putative E3 ubiquitin-protein ligase UBR7 [Osmerus eperlanus]|uniref:putative E3 ubiquitin-protein ligase UBR7 n=1 Tax=Osmerus eperlanus TaxID=29151 RepID=UPI002E12CB1F
MMPSYLHHKGWRATRRHSCASLAVFVGALKLSSKASYTATLCPVNRSIPSSKSLISLQGMAVNEDSEATLSLNDILEDDELREAMSVLAGSDPEKCSYPQGYVKRQAVFACNTCTPRGEEPAGLCLACTNKCHDGHDIFELYTKRNFRCDCGNNKFGEFRCKLIPNKDGRNIKNQYNHNFHGLYCFCDRPYPDTDDQVDEEMIQCIICEDWFHSRHLGSTVEDSEELQEMVCEPCMNRAPFLWTYAAHLAVITVSPCQEVDVEEVEEKEEVEEDVDVVDSSDQKEKRCNGGEGASSKPACQKQEKLREDENGNSSCKRSRQERSGSPGKGQARPVACRLKELQGGALKGGALERSREGAVFWPYHWRSHLCTCITCKRAYVQAGVQFLLDETDTLLAYENKGRTEPFGEDLLTSCLSSLDHIQQLEMIYHFNDLKTELTEFLQQFASEGKVVTAEAIQQFFEELQARKRRRTSGGQHHCT